MIFLELTKKGHRQSDQTGPNCFIRNTEETSERWSRVHMAFPEHVYTILDELILLITFI